MIPVRSESKRTALWQAFRDTLRCLTELDIEMMPRIIEVTEGDVLEPYILNLASGFTTNTVNVYAIVEVID